MIARPLFVLVAACLALTGCYREVHVMKQMTWACEPIWDRPSYPDVQSVRFRFVEDSHRSELVPGRRLCQTLRAQDKPVVNVEFVVFGDPWDGARGYRISAIDGKQYAPGGGWGSSRIEGLLPGQQPKPLFQNLIPTHRLF